MCNECCNVFKGWCKSFTRIEVVLSVLEGILLLLFLCLLIFVVTHCTTCTKQGFPHLTNTTDILTNITKDVTTQQQSTHANNKTHELLPSTNSSKYSETTISITSIGNLSSSKRCSWTPSARTEARIAYYEIDITPSIYLFNKIGSNKYSQRRATASKSTKSGFVSNADYVENTDSFDDDEPSDYHKKFVLALVKSGPSHEIEFGCVLTIVAEYWTVTAASCVKSVDETGSLHEFVMAESEVAVADGARHTVAGVRLHPQAQRGGGGGGGAGARDDVAALRSASALGPPALLPGPLDRILTTMGERLTVLDYGKLRSSGGARALRRRRAASAAAGRCGAAARARAGPGDAVGPYCAVIMGVGEGCEYAAAGRPLVRARTVLGVQAAGAGGAGRDGGAGCVFTSLAAVRDWLDDLIRADN